MTGTIIADAREQLAEATAKHILEHLLPAQDRLTDSPWVTVEYPDDRRPPRDAEGIKASLLAGECWISWMDDPVMTAMRRLHPQPTADPADASPCSDCGVMLPLDAECYAVDSGGVCGPCGKRRYGNKAEDYRIV